ncbi:MAG TPA: type II toxin-antitoxin system Phd/YefM family antitoxin [Kribbellaceae bacterium]|nr:type II toxin-antitoxin system Phd/YefM family antitoxin [Kribbellaceae bacterium]
MKTISHRELRNDSARILREIQAGESFEITNHGDVVALLVPPPADHRARLIRSGELRPAVARLDLRAVPRVTLPADAPGTLDVLDDLRGDR